jgi:hypothetical protein
MIVAPVVAAVVSALISVLLPALLKAPSGWSLRVPGWLGFVRLAYIRTAGAAVFGIAAPTAIGLSVSNDPHRVATYIAWYGVAAFGLAVVIATTMIIDRRSALAGGPGALGVANSAPTTEPPRVFVAVEAEIALACEEALEMAKMLRKEWPYITPEGALVQVTLSDWRSKTMDFIGVVLGAGQRAAFKAAGASGDNVLENLESECRFLESLVLRLAPDAIRVDEDVFLDARNKRRDHESASFLDYDHSRASEAPTSES